MKLTIMAVALILTVTPITAQETPQETRNYRRSRKAPPPRRRSRQ